MPGQQVRCLFLTDSGGIEKETPSLGKSVLMMRDKNERPDGTATGTLRLVRTGKETIYAGFTRLLTNKASYDMIAKTSNPYGDGHACEKIARILNSSS